MNVFATTRWDVSTSLQLLNFGMAFKILDPLLNDLHRKIFFWQIDCLGKNGVLYSLYCPQKQIELVIPHIGEELKNKEVTQIVVF